MKSILWLGSERPLRQQPPIGVASCGGLYVVPLYDVVCRNAGHSYYYADDGNVFGADSSGAQQLGNVIRYRLPPKTKIKTRFIPPDDRSPPAGLPLPRILAAVQVRCVSSSLVAYQHVGYPISCSS